MPPREWRVRLEDIIGAAERARGYVEGLTLEQFSADQRTIDAVSFAIVVIGEAARAMPEPVVLATPEVPWVAIRGMRNKIAHEYFGVDVSLLWQTVAVDLPPLIHQLRQAGKRPDLP